MDVNHTVNDEQSLLLTSAALNSLREKPDLLRDVLATLDHWDRVAPVDSKALRDQWRRILLSGDWSPLLACNELGQQLRQASPLSRAISPRLRLEIISACKRRGTDIQSDGALGSVWSHSRPLP